MSVFRHSSNQYKVTCDGPNKCPNHHIFGDSQEAVKEASDWLIRHGWRTIESELHYCPYCSNKLEVFHPEKEQQLYGQPKHAHMRRV